MSGWDEGFTAGSQAAASWKHEVAAESARRAEKEDARRKKAEAAQPLLEPATRRLRELLGKASAMLLDAGVPTSLVRELKSEFPYPSRKDNVMEGWYLYEAYINCFSFFLSEWPQRALFLCRDQKSEIVNHSVVRGITTLEDRELPIKGRVGGSIPERRFQTVHIISSVRDVVDGQINQWRGWSSDSPTHISGQTPDLGYVYVDVNGLLVVIPNVGPKRFDLEHRLGSFVGEAIGRAT